MWCAALVLSPTDLPAAPPTSASAAPSEQFIERIQQDFDAGKYVQALRRADAFLKASKAPRDVSFAQTYRGIALLALGREPDGLAAFATARAAVPDEAEIARLHFQLGSDLGSADVALAALDKLIDAFPDVARTLPREGLFRVLAGLRQAKLDARADHYVVRLARIGFGDGDAGDHLAMSAARIELLAGRGEEAARLTAPVVGREPLQEALVSRAFAPLWAQLEVQAGPNMERAQAAAVLRAERGLAERPGDVQARWDLVSALRQASRFAEADRQASGFAADEASMKAIDEAGGWLVNEHALVLHAAGRADEADARFAAMRAIDIAKNGWLISMIINRAELLVMDGKFSRAEPLLTEAANLARTHGSPYARQLIRRMRVCSLHGLKRTSELSPAIADMAAHGNDAALETVDGYLCLGRLDAAEALIVKALADPAAQARAVRALQAVPMSSDDPSLWTTARIELRRRPAVEAAFNKVGRDLPATLRPRRP